MMNRALIILILAVLAVLGSACGMPPGADKCVTMTCEKIDNCRTGVDDWEIDTVFCDVHWKEGGIVQWHQGDAVVGQSYTFCGPGLAA
jgi:hypothetical protein